MNNMIATGRITKDATLRTVTIGGVNHNVVDIDVAVNMGSGDTRRTTYVKCTFWDKQATALAPWLQKGRLVAIRGELTEPEVWIGDDGKCRAKNRLRGTSLEFLGAKPADAEEVPFDADPVAE